ncbi:MAG: hypothetical protein H7211_03095, partial [Aquabacterium sp.]|nr:hypothetical protein [Ferruginibacter sp.]
VQLTSKADKDEAGIDPSIRVYIFNHKNKIVYNIAGEDIIIVRLRNMETGIAAKY